MDALLFVSHRISPYILIKFQQLNKIFSKYGDSFLLLEENDYTRPYLLKCKNAYPFSWERLKNIGFLPLKSTITPGSNHFVTLSFFASSPNYDNYWSIEYDVDFLGDWNYFFSTANRLRGEFISCHIQNYSRNPTWYWWESYYNKSLCKKYDIPIELRMRSFNPIYKISKTALHFLYTTLRSGVYGHHEVVMPTLLHHNGFAISDFGGIPEDALGEKEGLYVTKSQYSAFGSMQHIPFTQFDCFMKWKNVLVHPVKL